MDVRDKTVVITAAAQGGGRAATLAFNAPVVSGKTASVLGALGLPDSTDEAEIREVAVGRCLDLGITMRLSGGGVPGDDLPRMAGEAHAIRRLLDNNPRDLPRDRILAMYQAAF